MKITLYVDVVSPFAYIAYYVLRVRVGGAAPTPSLESIAPTAHHH